MPRPRPTRWRAPCSMPAANSRRAPASCAPKSSAFWRRCASLKLFSVKPRGLGVEGAWLAHETASALRGGEISHIGDVLHADLRIPVLGVVAKHRVGDGRARYPNVVRRAAIGEAVVRHAGADPEAFDPGNGEIVGRPDIVDVRRHADR